ncbi:MAG: sensor domain-containing protein [Candidatus Sumerlaeaceae bacterium]
MNDIDLSSLFGALPDEIFVLDWDGIYQEVSAVSAGLLSSRGHELVGHSVQELFPSETADLFLGYIRSALSSKQGVHGEYVLQSSHGPIWYSASITPLSDTTVLWVARAITESKRAEKIRGVFAWLGAQLASAVDAQEAARTVLQAADEIVCWDAGFINLLADEESTDSELLTYSLVSFDKVHGERIDALRAGQTLPAGPYAKQALEQGAHLVQRISAPREEVVRFGNLEALSASLMFVPIRHGNRATGVMSIQSYTDGAYDEQDLHILQTLADFCSGALQRTYAEQRMRDSEKARVDSERRFQALIENSTDAVLLIDANACVTYVSPAIERLLGFKPEEYMKCANFSIFHEEDQPRAQTVFQHLLEHPAEPVFATWRMQHRDGEYRWLETTARNMLGDTAINGIICSMRDVTERQAVEQKLKHGAYHDALTDLANRAAFMEHLQRAIAKSERRSDYGFAVLFMDVDRFKVVNDSLGHIAGDRLLVQIAGRLIKCLRTSDIAARLGGDEFAFFIEDVFLPGDATRVAERVHQCLGEPCTIDGAEIFTSVSIGIALSSAGYEQPEDILRDADTAMYRAKGQGKGRYAIFDSQMHDKVVGQFQMESDLRRAIGRQELLLYYQPLVSLQNGHVVGFEALVRWQHPERGLVPPSEFIPLAEETDLISEIGWWVLREACQWMRSWQIESSIGRRLSINVNLSARQFTQPDLVEQIEAILKGIGLDPHCLKLEITETTIVENGESAIEMLSRLKELNVQLHVDDFGTGYSSLAYLHRFPIDALKIDKTFVQSLGKSEEALEISRAIIALARNMRMDPIAEGIETAEQLRILLELGCTLGQGFYFSRPLPAAEAKTLFERVFTCLPPTKGSLSFGGLILPN